MYMSCPCYPNQKYLRSFNNSEQLVEENFLNSIKESHVESLIFYHDSLFANYYRVLTLHLLLINCPKLASTLNLLIMISRPGFL